ncbi:transporter [Vibrio breoganii]|uniref:sodium:solute symporter family transporter n=1 Tax=Vibrio breoganii TaxID=553239 RepID=UPI0003063904|nr:transporter [Vibrio breoganii]OCH73697.1 transporter [Vibrio breoganii]OED87934.1 transporter [Vibrio breoganii ZF-55]OED98170.1 transporter [Vibrio breoganii ZF-29]PMG79301.1 transporter [Vibrio breoganii]PML04741.1 transporter [Vibrio breoganii]
MDIDIIVVLVYFIFLIGLGWVFRSAASNTSEYFRGGGRMLWWMVGSSAFMMALSAMTFTGLMGKALTSGMSVAVVFFANALGYFCNYLFFAAKARQMRVISPLQGIRLRLGAVNEQVFTWANVPLSVLQAAIWLNGLAVFTSAVIGVPLEQTIIGAGLVVLFMSLVGGSWAVIASDFMQMIIITVMTFIAAMVAIWKSGGVGNLLEVGLPTQQLIGDGYSYSYLFVGWFICIFVKQFFSTNNMVDSYRFIASKDTKNARKAALLACSLMILGPLVWFLPAWYVAGNYPDVTTWGLEGLGDKVADATYYMFVKSEMPVGMVGLMLAAMFAATMSSMDSALNRNAGIILKSVYEPYFCKDFSEKNLMRASKVLTAIFGIVIILTGLFLTSLKEFGLFDLMMLVGTLVGFPVLIPSIMCFFVRKTPDWAGWGTILVGMCVSAVIAFVITPNTIETILGLDTQLTAREFSEMKSVTLGVIGHMSITLPFFVLSRFFYKEPSAERAAEINQFFNNVDTEVVVEESEQSILMDNKQHIMLGKMLLTASVFLAMLTLVPNPLWGKALFAIIAGIIGFIGFILLRTVKKPAELQVKQSCA